MPVSNPTKLFAVLLGGRAEGCNIELHDIQFTTGSKISDCYQDLLAKWFGLPERMHLDAYMVLDYIDGHEISLRKEKSKQSQKLYFINLGAYEEGNFTELHATRFLVDTSKLSVKKRAKESLLVGKDSVHTDDLYDVDDCISITEINGWHVHLTPTETKENLIPTLGYMPLSKAVVKIFLESRE